MQRPESQSPTKNVKREKNVNFAQNLHLNSALGVIQFAGSCAKLLLESGWYDNCAAALTQHAFCLLAQLPTYKSI